MKFAEKVFQTLFSTTSQTIHAVKAGQLELKKQIQSITATIQDLKASFEAMPSFEAVSEEIRILKLNMKRVEQKILIPQVTREDCSVLINQINTLEKNYAFEIQALKNEIEALKQTQSLVQPVSETEIIPTPKPKTKARAIAATQTKVKPVKMSDRGILPWSEFQNVLKRALKIIPKNGIIRQLSNALIVTNNNTVRVVCTDLEVGYTALLDCDNLDSESRNKSFLIGRDLVETLSKTNGEISFSYDAIDKIACFDAGSFKTKHKCGDISEYPRLPGFNDSDLILSDCPELISTLSKSISAVSIDTAKSTLTGTCVVRDSFDQITIASTDGYKLFVDSLQANNASWDNVQFSKSGNNKTGTHFILPRSVIKYLNTFKSQSVSKVYVNHSHCKIEIASGESVYARLIEGIFPNFNQILPKSFSRNIKIDRKQWLSAVKELKGFVSKETKIFTVDLNYNAVSLHSGHEQCDITTSATLRDGDPLKISFNRDYFEALLSSFDCDELIMGFNSEIQPALLRDESKHYSQRKFMIMPVKP